MEDTSSSPSQFHASSELSAVYTGRRVAVTGASGLIGHRLVYHLLEAGADVVGLARRPRPQWFPEGASYQTCDLSDRRAATTVLDGCDTVFHLAAVGWGLRENVKRQPELFTENVLLTTTVLDAAYRAGVARYLYASSSAVYPASAETLDEDDPLTEAPHPTEFGFGMAKRMGEIQTRLYAEHHGMRVAIVRPANVYGPGDDFSPERAHLIPALICRIASGERPLLIHGTGRSLRSFIYVDDVARAMLVSLSADGGAPINVASPTVTSVGDVARIVAEKSGLGRGEVRFDGDGPEGHPGKRPLTMRLSELVELDSLTPLADGIAATVRWYRDWAPGMVRA